MNIFSCEFCGDHMGQEDTMPRVLRCGHTFCTPCVSEFYGGGEYKCPTCSRQLHSKFFSSIPVNHALLKVIKAKMSSGEKNVKELMILPAISTEKNSKHSDNVDESQSILHDYEIETAPSPNEPHQHAGKCITHDAYCLFWCKSCKEWICHYCFVTAHPPLVCEIRHFDQALHEIKLEGDQCIKKTIELFDNHTDKYNKIKSALKDKREKNRALIKEIQTLLLKHQKAYKDIEIQTEAIKSTLADGLSTLLTLLESQRQLLEAQTSHEVFSARHQAQVCQSRILDWLDPNNLLLNEEIAYSDELQKSTFTAITVLKDLLSSSDNNDFESQTTGLTTLSKKDEDAVARNLKHLLENSVWKDIMAMIENNQFSSDSSLHSLANMSCRTDVRQYDLGKGLGEAYVMQHRQRGAKATTCGKFEVPNENLIDLTSDERECRVQCPLLEKPNLTPDSRKQLEYNSMNTYISAKIKPQLEGISETEEPLEILTWKHAWQEEEEQNEIGKFVVAKGNDDNQALQLEKRIRLLEDGYVSPNQITLKSPGFKELDFANEGKVKGDQFGVESEIDREHDIKREVQDKLYTTDICGPSKYPSKTSSAVSKVKQIYAKVEENFPENSLSKDSRNELDLLDESFDNGVSQSKSGKKCEDPQNFRVCCAASEVGTEYGCDCKLGGAGSTAYKGNTIAVSGVGHIASGGVIVVAGDEDGNDDDDDVDDDNFSTKEYKCDIILPLESKEIQEIRRTEQRLKTEGLLLEGEYGRGREAFIQDSNNEENDVALCKEKGLVFDGDGNDDDDDVDDDNFSTKEYKCDIILPLESKEIQEIRRTEQRLKTEGLLLEGEYGRGREAFIQDSNNEENDVALCKEKGLVFDGDGNDDDDDVDDDNFSTKEYKCDIILPLESKEIQEIRRTEQRLKTEGLLLEGEYGRGREAFIQDSNNEENDVALCKEKGLVFDGDGNDDDDDVDDDNFSTKEYKCDIILPLESKEIQEIRRTEQRLKTEGLLLEGEYGRGREAFIQDSNNEENDVALCKDKGLVFDGDGKISGDLISWCDVHTDENTITTSPGYQTEDVIAMDRHNYTKETDQTESDHSDEFFLTPTIDFGAEHCPIGHNNSAVSSEKEAGEIETAYGIESDTTVAIDDLDESQRYMRYIIPESNGDSATQVTCSEVLEDNVENADTHGNESRIGDRCRVM